MENKASNAKRFMDAYNRIDNLLRALYNYKGSMTFTDMIRQAAAVNYVVRKYEEDLIDYARLRNAIVHKSKGDRVIAEPHADVADEMQHIAGLLQTPPGAYKFARDNDVMTFSHDARLKEVVIAMSARGYSNVPIIKDGMILGVLSNKQITDELGRRLKDKQDAGDFFNNTRAGDILDNESRHYTILEKTASIERVLSIFRQNGSLRVVLFTADGSCLSPPLGIITTGDLLELDNELERYL